MYENEGGVGILAGTVNSSGKGKSVGFSHGSWQSAAVISEEHHSLAGGCGRDTAGSQGCTSLSQLRYQTGEDDDRNGG